MPGIKWIEPIVFSKSSRNPIFSQIFGHQRAENEARNTKMETHPIRVKARYEINWTNSYLKSSENPIFGQIFGHQWAENEPRNTEMYRGQETDPIMVNARHEMNGTRQRTDNRVNPVYPHSTFDGAGV